MRGTSQSLPPRGPTVGVLPADQFVALWNDAGSLAEVVERVRELPGGPFPRWAVLARAIACRQNGLDLKPFPDEASIPRVGPLSRARELAARLMAEHGLGRWEDRKSTRLNSRH